MLLTILLVLNTILLAVLLARALTPREDDDRVERLVREEMANNRRESAQSIHAFTDQLLKLTDMNERKLEKVREVVETRLQALQEDNSKKLEKMRETVDEKLHSTLEKRLGESFRMVSDRLEKVHAGLGEMQSLASGVGDLKKVLTNVKTRGTWGEIQLGNLLEQMLTVDQYERNVVTKQGSRDPVEFVIKLPGRDGKVVHIPIDAKFPKEDYERLLLAQDEGNVPLIEELGKVIENKIKMEAKKIRDKYIDPPQTTDFAIMYLPIEGLFAEVLRRPGLHEQLQRDFRVSIAGPTTITAHLNALQMGFRTLAVEKRASEVWQLLGAVKNEFGKFGIMLENTKKKLDSASKEIEFAAANSRTIEKKLNKVQELPSNVKPDLIADESSGVPSETFDEDIIVQ
ncbi:MAG: DNA recombination protein RmuC [Candidatus Omnitrophica bacterium]|nr:DNA recombination protein RmuC [Candidatus Omnitrophota bacterium]